MVQVEEMLVLGIVPHTNIQISFAAWLFMIIGMVSFIVFAHNVMRLTHAVRAEHLARRAYKLMALHHLV